MNSSLYIAQATADLRKPHPLRNDPFFGHYVPHEAAQELVRALKGGRKANPSGAGKALRAAHKVCIRLDQLMTRFEEEVPTVDWGPSVSSEPSSSLPVLMADASRDAREIAKLVRFRTGAITFAANRAEAHRLAQLLRGKLERILFVNTQRPITAATMLVEDIIASVGTGNVVAHPRLAKAAKR